MRNLQTDWRNTALNKDEFICKRCQKVTHVSKLRDDYICSDCHYKTVYIPRRVRLYDDTKGIDFAYRYKDTTKLF